MPHTRSLSHSFVDSLKKNTKESVMFISKLKPAVDSTSDGFGISHTEPVIDHNSGHSDLSRLSLEMNPETHKRVSFDEPKTHYDNTNTHEGPIVDNSYDDLEKLSREKRPCRSSTENQRLSLSSNSHIFTSSASMMSDNPGSFATLCELQLASEKKNNDFHSIFRSVPPTDMLIDVYKCALSKEILLQGHLYISENHVCFKSNIFGWITNLIINFNEITMIEKRMTAKIIPNGIMIDTHAAKHIFASFIFRDQAYERMVKIWELHKRTLSPPSSRFSQSYVTSDEDSMGSTDIRSMRSADSALMLGSIHHSAKKDSTSPVVATAQTNTHIDNTLLVAENIPWTSKNRQRSVSDSHVNEAELLSIINLPQISNNVQIVTKKLSTCFLADKEIICPCSQKNEKFIHTALDAIYPGTVEAFDRLFFQEDFTKRVLERYDNYEDVQLEDWTGNLRKIVATKVTMPSATHAKVAKVVLKEKREHYQLPYYSCTTTKKSMIGTPMDAMYYIRSRTCITRISAQKIRLLVTFEVSFKKAGLVSSIIESNAADDQLKYYERIKSLLAAPDSANGLIQDKELLKMLKSGSMWSIKDIESWMKHPLRLDFLLCVAFILFSLIQMMLFSRLCRISNRIQALTEHLKESEPQIHNYEQLLNDLIEKKANLYLDYEQVKKLADI